VAVGWLIVEDILTVVVLVLIPLMGTGAAEESRGGGMGLAAVAQAGATTTVFEEGEAGVALARHVMRRRGVDEATIEKLLSALRRIWDLPG
jgi:predicted Kef-type K+ transport protein